MIDHRKPSTEEIARQAHELYVRRGGEHGKDVEDWIKAERALRDESVVASLKAKATEVNRRAVN